MARASLLSLLNRFIWPVVARVPTDGGNRPRQGKTYRSRVSDIVVLVRYSGRGHPSNGGPDVRIVLIAVNGSYRQRGFVYRNVFSL